MTTSYNDEYYTEEEEEEDYGMQSTDSLKPNFSSQLFPSTRNDSSEISKLRLLNALTTLTEAMMANTSVNEAMCKRAQIVSTSATLNSDCIQKNHIEPSTTTSFTPSHAAGGNVTNQWAHSRNHLHQRRLTAINPYAFRALDDFKFGTERRPEKVVVEVRVVFLKIGEIDTLKELYHADVFIQTKWREPKLDNMNNEELAKIDLSKCWNPLIYIDNILSESKDTQWSVAQCDPHGYTHIIDRRRVKGHFMETLELFDFPLDVQDLTVTLTTERSCTEVDLIPDQNELSAINKQTFVDHQEWRLHEHVDITKEIIAEEYSSSMNSHPFISVTCKASRRPGYFYWNVFLIMFFITSLSFATFSVSVYKIENRLQLSFTLFLTSVTFKFVINQSLPKISYLTYMDKYVLMSLGMLSLVSVWHAIATLLPAFKPPQRVSGRKTDSKSVPTNESWTNQSLNSTDSHSPSETASTPSYSIESIENKVFLILITTYLLFHVIFILWMYFGVSRKRRIVRAKDEDYKTFLQRRREWARLRERVLIDPSLTTPLRPSSSRVNQLI